LALGGIIMAAAEPKDALEDASRLEIANYKFRIEVTSYKFRKKVRS
jgi:hypothetical protein